MTTATEDGELLLGALVPQRLAHLALLRKLASQLLGPPGRAARPSPSAVSKKAGGASTAATTSKPKTRSESPRKTTPSTEAQKSRRSTKAQQSQQSQQTQTQTQTTTTAAAAAAQQSAATPAVASASALLPCSAATPARHFVSQTPAAESTELPPTAFALSSTTSVSGVAPSSLLLLPPPRLVPLLQRSLTNEHGQECVICCVNPVGDGLLESNRCQLCAWEQDSRHARCLWRLVLEQATCVTQLHLLKLRLQQWVAVVVASPIVNGKLDAAKPPLLWLLDAVSGVVLYSGTALAGGLVAQLTPVARADGRLLLLTTTAGNLYLVNPTRTPVDFGGGGNAAGNPSTASSTAFLQSVADLSSDLPIKREGVAGLEAFVVGASGANANAHAHALAVHCVVRLESGAVFGAYEGIWVRLDTLGFEPGTVDFWPQGSGPLASLCAESAATAARRLKPQVLFDKLIDAFVDTPVADRSADFCMSQCFAAAYLRSRTEFLQWLRSTCRVLRENEAWGLLWEIAYVFVILSSSASLEAGPQEMSSSISWAGLAAFLELDSPKVLLECVAKEIFPEQSWPTDLAGVSDMAAGMGGAPATPPATEDELREALGAGIARAWASCSSTAATKVEKDEDEEERSDSELPVAHMLNRLF